MEGHQVTVANRRRLRRVGGDDYVVHREDLRPEGVGWWQEVPTVTAPTAIAQCIADVTPTCPPRQAVARGHARGCWTTTERGHLAETLEERHAR